MIIGVAINTATMPISAVITLALIFRWAVRTAPSLRALVERTRWEQSETAQSPSFRCVFAGGWASDANMNLPLAIWVD
jgi:hypothetical protein